MPIPPGEGEAGNETSAEATYDRTGDVGRHGRSQ